MTSVMVTKHNGEKEPYDEVKIRSSATRVGVPENLQNEMINMIRSRLYDGIPTRDIFTIIKSYLSTSESPYLASKYNLKKSLSELGPSGYPFEQYVARLLQAKDYVTKTNQTLQGSCVTHEVDVVATKDNITYPIEAKFHTSESQRTDVRVALYIWARYEDIKNAWQGPTEIKPWIVTNTRFSTDAIKYARCKDVRITSWGYPKDAGIMDIIEETCLHPITVLESLSSSEKRFLISSGVLVCKDLLVGRNDTFIPESKRQHVINEAKGVVGCQK